VNFLAIHMNKWSWEFSELHLNYVVILLLYAMNSRQKTSHQLFSPGYDKTEILVKGFSSNYPSASACSAPTRYMHPKTHGHMCW